MGLFKKNKLEKQNVTPKRQGLASNQLNEDDLLNIAGGQDFHSEEEELNNINATKNIISKYK